MKVAGTVALTYLVSAATAFVPFHEEKLPDSVEVEDQSWITRRLQESEISAETEEIFEAAATTTESDLGGSITFDNPIKFTQYLNSDTCSFDDKIYSGEIYAIESIDDGVFCITEGDGDGSMNYTKLENAECSVFGVTDVFSSCSDSSCSDCADPEYVGFLSWAEVFPAEFDGHCFQQTFGQITPSGNFTFDDAFNIDYSFPSGSATEALEYKKFIAQNSCISQFVASEDVTFTEDSVSISDGDGGSVTVTEDSITLEDEEGSITITDGTDGQGADVTLSDNEGNEFTVEDANVTFTDDGAVIIESDDAFVAVDEDGIIVMTDDVSVAGNSNITIVYNREDGTTDWISTETGDCLTISEACSLDDMNFTIFCGLWQEADLPDDAYTVFVPTDDAFTSLFGVLSSQDIELDDDTIAAVVGFHIAMGMTMSDDLECGKEMEMALSGNSRTQCGNMDDGSGLIYLIQKGGGNRRNNILPYIIDADNMFCKSVVHVIDEVMLPNFIPTFE